MKFPILPAGISVVLGAADGFIASHDVNAYAKVAPAGTPAGSAPPLSHSKTLWLQGGAIGIGVIGEFMNWHPDVTESLMFTGAALVSRSVSFRLAQDSSNKTNPVAAQGYMRAVAAAPNSAAPNFGSLDAGAASFNYRQRTTRVA